jgi:iron complex outermembrane recepter protein
MQTRPTRLMTQLSQAGLVTMSLAFAPHAMAQQDASTQRIEITGSNIKRLAAEGNAPVQTITRDQLDRSPLATVGELLRDISANTGGSSSETATNSQSGAAGISLRGLGQKSTLVLINGRRMANHAIAQGGQDTFVDLNSIPKSAVARIEVLKDGASAIYGSDAIAGVVNIILRKDFTGVEIGANIGHATQGGLDEQGASLAGGFNAGKLNVMAVLDVFHRDLLLYSDRPWLNGLDFRFLPGGTFFPASSGGTWVRPTGAPGLARTPIPNCIPPSMRMPANIISSFVTGTACGYTVDKYLTGFPEADRVGVFSRAVYQLSSNTDLFAELSLANNQSNWINQPQTITNTTVSFNPTTGGFNSYSNVIPFIPAHAAVNATNPYGRPASLNYTFFDVGARTFDLETKTSRAVAGISSTFGAWDWQAAAGTSQSKVVEVTGNQVDGARLRTFIASGGYDFLAPTAAQTAALRISTTRNATSKLHFADVKASTELMKLAHGPLGFAAGLETRRESLVDTPDPLAQQGRLIGTGSSRSTGSRTATAAYGEFSIPLAKGLEVQAAGRADHYSDFGSAFSPKLGMKFAMSPQALVRASVSKGFRAPTLVENANSASLGFGSVLDPARNNASTIIGILNSGSKDLKAETSVSSTIGFVLEPAKDVSVAVDYYRINQKDLVSLNGAQFIVRNPSLFPGAIVRDPITNQILVVFDNYTNQSNVVTSGIDLDVGARFAPTPIGRFALRGNASLLLDWTYRPTAAATPVNYAGRNDGPNGSLPSVRSRVSLDWMLPSFTTTLSLNHIGEYQQRNTTSPLAEPTVAESNTLDVYFAYTGIKNLKLSFSVNNLFDSRPPWDVASGVGISNSQYNLRGRYVRAGVDYKF